MNKRIKVAVVVQQIVLTFDASGGNHRIDGLAHRDGYQGDQQFSRGFKIAIPGEPLEDFREEGANRR